MSSDETDRKARRATSFAGLGAEVQRGLVPMHLEGVPIWTAISLEGATELMIDGNGLEQQLAPASTWTS